MKNIVFLALLLVAIQNVICRKSTFCPKVQPMEGFKWEPVNNYI
jgi:hypothetical protein